MEGVPQISFADFTHTGQIVAANTFPFGASLVAAYAQKMMGSRIAVELFKYPADFSAYLSRTVPQVAAFSHYLWNSQLALNFARRIKAVSPSTISVFGGPNYPLDEDAQDGFLLEHPEIDFYIPLEGEKGFAGLLQILEDSDWDARQLKRRCQIIPSVHYAVDGRIIRGALLDRLKSLTEIPSPYQTGLLDKFFDHSLIPMIETNRGCPFSCTFCEIGTSYHTKVHRSVQDRVAADLEYIADRVQVADLMIVDSNFGMFKEDLETCKLIANLQARRGWPKYVANTSGKNQKERVLEAARILDGAMQLAVAIQSADPVVLDNVKRRNISLDQIVEVGKGAEAVGANTYCEIVLGLPGDSRQAHFDTVSRMIDADMNEIFMWQLMLLPGAEVANRETREKFGMVGRYRVLPRCFGHYEAFGETFSATEIEEICVSQSSMSFEDYLACRELNFTVEIFYNNGAFRELIEFVKLKGFSPSSFVATLHDLARGSESSLGPLYEGFLTENREKLWDDRKALEAFVALPGAVDRFISGELGGNELYKNRALAFFQHQRTLHDLAFKAARTLIETQGPLDGQTTHYLQQLATYSLLRKDRLLDTEHEVVHAFDFDFATLERAHFHADPREHAGPVTLCIRHTPEQQELIASYISQYGTSVEGLGRLLLRCHVNKLFRQTRYAYEGIGVQAAQ